MEGTTSSLMAPESRSRMLSDRAFALPLPESPSAPLTLPKDLLIPLPADPYLPNPGIQSSQVAQAVTAGATTRITHVTTRAS